MLTPPAHLDLSAMQKREALLKSLDQQLRKLDAAAEIVMIVGFDKIVQVDGKSLQNVDTLNASQLIRGPAGSTVNLVIQRAGQTLQVPVVRGPIRVTPVEGSCCVRESPMSRSLGFLRAPGACSGRHWKPFLPKGRSGRLSWTSGGTPAGSSMNCGTSPPRCCPGIRPFSK